MKKEATLSETLKLSLPLQSGIHRENAHTNFPRKDQRGEEHVLVASVSK